jgi:hypothetical protein
LPDQARIFKCFEIQGLENPGGEAGEASWFKLSPGVDLTCLSHLVFKKNPTYCLNPADHLDVEIADGKKSPEIFTNTYNPGY